MLIYGEYDKMGKLITVDDKVAKELDEIRVERNCSYSKAIAMLLAEQGKKERNLTQITEYFAFFERIMPNIRYELECIRITIIWLYKMSTRDRKEAAEDVREDLEEIMNKIVEKKKKKE